MPFENNTQSTTVSMHRKQRKKGHQVINTAHGKTKYCIFSMHKYTGGVLSGTYIVMQKIFYFLECAMDHKQ